MTDSEFLNWLGDRLVHVYGESKNVDFVLKVRRLAQEANKQRKAVALIQATHEWDEERQAWTYDPSTPYKCTECASREAASPVPASAQGDERRANATRVKVERTCPRCHTRAYHRGNDRGVINRIACVNCGHEWAGRIRQDEQRDVRYAESEVKKAVDATYDQDYMAQEESVEPWVDGNGVIRTGVLPDAPQEAGKLVTWTDAQIGDWIADAQRSVFGVVPQARYVLERASKEAGKGVIHQFRKKHCSDWYDGFPDTEDGGGPYETRTLYVADLLDTFEQLRQILGTPEQDADALIATVRRLAAFDSPQEAAEREAQLQEAREQGWRAAIDVHSRHGMAGWSSHKDVALAKSK